MAAPLVVVEREDDGAFVLSLNRPDKLNALSIELREAAAAELRGLAGDKDCRGLVLTGTGKAFCAGMDFSQFGGGRENRQRL
ncbi:MAG: enoyl-CoA hydratase/isomerase family protein, partial [Alphaproteobacteria bacterium]|nr:enoyl-CoA hydratase/isomerase family protein [Alphaproteobacteria bacterium]